MPASATKSASLKVWQHIVAEMNGFMRKPGPPAVARTRHNAEGDIGDDKWFEKIQASMRRAKRLRDHQASMMPTKRNDVGLMPATVTETTISAPVRTRINR